MGMHLEINKSAIGKFCQNNHIRKLAFFGSVLRDDFSPSSDVDVLVEFEDGHKPGLRFFDIEAELSAMLGCKVDLNTLEFLSRYFRDSVKKEAEVQYAAP